MKRETSRFSSKFLDRILKMETSEKIVTIATLLLTIFILGGGLYNLIYAHAGSLMTIIPIGRGYIFYYPYSINEQTLTMSICIMMFYAIGAVGLILIHQSTKYLDKPRRAYATLLLGITLAILAYALIEYFYNKKISGF